MDQINSEKIVKSNIQWVIGGYLLILVLVSLTLKLATDTVNQVNERLRTVVENNNVKSQYMLDMRDAIRERIILLHTIYLLDDPFDIDDKIQEYRSLARKFIAARDKLNQMNLTEKQKGQLVSQRNILAKAQPILDNIVETIQDEGDLSTLKEKILQAQSLNQQVNKELESMRQLQQHIAELSLQESNKAMAQAKNQIGLLVIAVCIIASIVLFVVIRVISRQSNLLKSLLDQLKQVNSNLEKEVEKRTEELLGAREENARMGAELEVTSRIQQMLLPLQGELDRVVDLDIAASMKPAEEVGGDYYDVLAYHDKTIIAIGDVTGHGLDSSIVMLMTQAAVRTLAVSNIESPVQFVHILNQTIFDNLQRLESYKNLTLMLGYYQNSELTVCGQHEDILLVRSGADKVDRVDTVDFGFPIGIERNIEPFLNSYHIHLQTGDTLLLYTDGIPEAENSKGEYYGIDRLCACFLKNIHLSVDEIHNAIKQDLFDFIGDQKIYDDVTLLIIRKN